MALASGSGVYQAPSKPAVRRNVQATATHNTAQQALMANLALQQSGQSIQPQNPMNGLYSAGQGQSGADVLAQYQRAQLGDSFHRSFGYGTDDDIRGDIANLSMLIPGSPSEIAQGATRGVGLAGRLLGRFRGSPRAEGAVDRIIGGTRAPLQNPQLLRRMGDHETAGLQGINRPLYERSFDAATDLASRERTLGGTSAMRSQVDPRARILADEILGRAPSSKAFSRGAPKSPAPGVRPFAQNYDKHMQRYIEESGHRMGPMGPGDLSTRDQESLLQSFPGAFRGPVQPRSFFSREQPAGPGNLSQRDQQALLDSFPGAFTGPAQPRIPQNPGMNQSQLPIWQQMIGDRVPYQGGPIGSWFDRQNPIALTLGTMGAGAGVLGTAYGMGYGRRK